MRQPRMQPGSIHLLSMPGNSSVCADRPQLLQQFDRLTPGSLRRQIDPAEPLRFAHAPRRQFKRQRDQVAFKYFRRIAQDQSGILLFGP